MNVLRIGTRTSRLATAQAGLVADLIRRAFPGLPVELVGLSGRGDELPDLPIDLASGPGFFTSHLQRALLEGAIDLAVHSLKDLPVAEPEGLAVAAVPLRENPRDVLAARDGLDLSRLPPGAVVGTGSPRRAAQIGLARPDLEVRPIRGNVETRLGLVQSGAVDAVVLAAAGLARLGMLERATQVLDGLAFLPAPGQGALALEAPTGRPVVFELASSLDDASLSAAVRAERAFLSALGGGCSAAAGGLAVCVNGRLKLSAGLYLDAPYTTEIEGPVADPERLGRRAAARLREKSGIVT